MKRLVLAGGGHAHIEVLRELALRPDEGREVTLVTPVSSLVYSGMLPGFIAGHYEIDDCTVDLKALALRANATVVQSAATLASTSARELICSNGTVIPYDVLSLDIGAQPFVGGARGLDKHAIVLRPLQKALKGWSDVLVRARDGKIGAVTVVGGGAGGVELALAMEYRLRQELGLASAHVRIISNASQLVPEFSARARRILAAKFARRNIGMHLGQTVTEVGSDYVRLEHGLEFASDAVFWATGPAAQDWVRDSGLATDGGGYLLTNEFLQSASHPEVFGVGDCATPQAGSQPKAGVFAVRAAPLLAENLLAALDGKPLQPFVTSPRYLALLSTGNRHAIGNWGRYGWEGAWVWRWKDRIDRRFIARYRPAPLVG